MKYLLLVPGLIITLFISCRKDNHITVLPFDYAQAAGIWVPYEVTDEIGAVHTGPITANSIFGSYAESVQLNKDKTFIPITWIDKNTFILKTDETGTFEYLMTRKLKFKGLIEFECDLTRFEGDELWLKMHSISGEVLYKFRRQN